MRVLILEDNLLWSVRLANAARALGHEVEVLARMPETVVRAEAAILDLGSARFPVREVVPRLRAAGAWVIGHAGHREGGVLAAGNAVGCDRVATNREVASRLGELLAEVRARPGG